MFNHHYRTPRLWQEMDRLQREMSRLSEAFGPRRYRTAPAYPAMNVWMSEDKLLVTSEVPGVSPKDIDVSVVNDTLTLSGERSSDSPAEGAQYYRNERGFGKFSRSLQLPYPVDANKVEASFKHGVLRITLPRKEEDKPRKIKVKS